MADGGAPVGAEAAAVVAVGAVGAVDAVIASDTNGWSVAPRQSNMFLHDWVQGVKDLDESDQPFGVAFTKRCSWLSTLPAHSGDFVWDRCKCAAACACEQKSEQAWRTYQCNCHADSWAKCCCKARGGVLRQDNVEKLGFMLCAANTGCPDCGAGTVFRLTLEINEQKERHDRLDRHTPVLQRLRIKAVSPCRCKGTIWEDELICYEEAVMREDAEWRDTARWVGAYDIDEEEEDDDDDDEKKAEDEKESDEVENETPLNSAPGQQQQLGGKRRALCEPQDETQEETHEAKGDDQEPDNELDKVSSNAARYASRLARARAAKSIKRQKHD